METKKDYIKTLRNIKHNFERNERLMWDDMRGEYRNAIEAIDKAIEVLQEKGYQTPDQCPFCGGNSTLHSAIDKYFWVRCEKCNASIQPESTPAAAIKKWNHRYTPKGMDLGNLYSNFCTCLKNMTSEELAESLHRAEEDSKDSYIFNDYDN